MFLRSPWLSCISLPTCVGEYLPVPAPLRVCQRWELAWKNPLTRHPLFLQGPRRDFGPAAFPQCCWLTACYCKVACLCQAGCYSPLNILLLQARCLAAIAVADLGVGGPQRVMMVTVRMTLLSSTRVSKAHASGSTWWSSLCKSYSLGLLKIPSVPVERHGSRRMSFGCRLHQFCGVQV